MEEGTRGLSPGTQSATARVHFRNPMKTISFLGAGNMAEALIKGVIEASLFSPEQVIASDISTERLRSLRETYNIRTTASNPDAASDGELVIIGVKPLLVDTVLTEVAAFLKGKLVISVAAGIPMMRLRAHLGEEVAVIRAMPNAGARVLAGATALSMGPSVSPAQRDWALSIFNAIGKTWVVEEPLQDAVTGLSGSGPAYIMVVIEAMAEGGIKCGLDPDMALALSAQTVLGASLWFQSVSEHPARLKDLVASPGGTTMAGLHQLEAGGLRAALISAVEAATRRSIELGQK